MRSIHIFGLHKVRALDKLQEAVSSIWKNSHRRGGYLPKISSKDIASIIWHHRKMYELVGSLEQAQKHLTNSFKNQKFLTTSSSAKILEQLAEQSRNVRSFKNELFILIRHMESKLENVMTKLIQLSSLIISLINNIQTIYYSVKSRTKYPSLIQRCTFA